MGGSSAAGAAGAAGTPLVISPDATCAAVARRHITEALLAIDRPGLIDCARLAVTELATNAALHAQTLVTVTVRVLPGGGVRIEVGDRSTLAPQQHQSRPTSTVGRGLQLVGSLGRWGVDPLWENGRRVGKVVWFSPAELSDDPPADRQLPADQEHPDVGWSGKLDEIAPPDDGPQERVTVRLLNVPLRVFDEASEYHDELMRELALLSLQPPEARQVARPLPGRLVELVDLLGRRRGATAKRGRAAYIAALARGDLTANLTYHVEPTAAQDMARLAVLLDEVDTCCRSGWLLTMPSPALLTRFRRWYTDEFVRQVAGLPPTPWGGPLSMEDPVPPT